MLARGDPMSTDRQPEGLTAAIIGWLGLFTSFQLVRLLPLIHFRLCLGGLFMPVQVVARLTSQNLYAYRG